MTVNPEASSFEGYHQFLTGGSFEVFYTDDLDSDPVRPGWYWWACPDGEPCGPFETSKEAYDDARGEP